MPRAIIIRGYGPPEVLRIEEVSIPAPPRGHLRLRQTAVGVNYHDVYVRSGLYRTLSLPGIPGLEGVGDVIETGADTAPFSVGDRVAYIHGGYGAYADERIVPADACIKLPQGISDKVAASILLKGITATVLATQVQPVQAGQTVLVHAASGGVGHLLAQWCKHLGAHVIGTAGSPEKARIARDCGCDEVIAYQEADFAERVWEITGGRGADIVYDAVGRDTFDRSLAALAPCAHLVVYGQASGPIAPFDLNRIASKSASITRANYSQYVSTAEDLRQVAADLWSALASGSLWALPASEWPLEDAAGAHRALENRAQGPFVLTT